MPLKKSGGLFSGSCEEGEGIAPDVRVIMVTGAGDLDLAKRALAFDLAQLSLTVEAALAWKGLDAR